MIDPDLGPALVLVLDPDVMERIAAALEKIAYHISEGEE